jgi:AraC-like DNA-binding protein
VPVAPPPILLTIAVCATRDRARALARAAFPRRRCRLVLARTAGDLERTFRETLVDAALVDVHAPSEDTWRAVHLAVEFPSAPFFALTPLRPSDAAVAARCAAADVADLVTEGMDDGVVRDLVLPRAFTSRFTEALAEPPAALGLAGRLHRDTWSFIVAHGGRPVRTDAIAVALGVTREHLSRSFSAGGAANLKRIIDLVRLLAAAELSKNPGYDVSDVARVLDYASSSHLSTTSQRIAGTKPGSLARLRGLDLVDRFVKERTRSRTA